MGKDLGDALGMATEWKERLQQVVFHKAGESWRAGIGGQKEERRSPPWFLGVQGPVHAQGLMLLLFFIIEF